MTGLLSVAVILVLAGVVAVASLVIWLASAILRGVERYYGRRPAQALFTFYLGVAAFLIWGVITNPTLVGIYHFVRQFV